MVLKDSGGAVIDVAVGEAEFVKAMAAPEPGAQAAPEMPAPARVDPDAPYGRKVDGSPKKAPGGRPPKDDKPRVTAGVTPSGEPRDYTADLVGITKSLHIVLAMIPPTQAQAALLKLHTPAMVPAWNLAAQQNEQVRTALEWLSGPGTWPVAVAAASVPFGLASIALWRGGPKSEMHQALTAMTVADLERMAADQARMMSDAGFEPAAA